MGVRGLASYFSHRELFFEETVLRDCTVVIDGNNLRQGGETFRCRRAKVGLV